jgi:hypothetical protein
VAPSSGTCDLFDSNEIDQNGIDENVRKKRNSSEIEVDSTDSSSVRAELAEADSTGPCYEFYS